MLEIAFVAYIVIAGVPTYPASNPYTPFADVNDCWEWIDHALESGDLKLGEGVRADCIPKIEEQR